MFALNLCSISELLVKKSERANCENRCRGNNPLGGILNILRSLGRLGKPTSWTKKISSVAVQREKMQTFYSAYQSPLNILSLL